MSCAEEYSPQLRARGYRMTPQRLAILHVLHHEDRHLSPVEIHEEARRQLPTLTEPTVYRTLEFFAENGLIRPALTSRGHLAYEIARHEHHHLICRRCGNGMEVKHDVLKSMYAHLELESGYRLTGSHLTFFGLCPHCKKGD